MDRVALVLVIAGGISPLVALVVGMLRLGRRCSRRYLALVGGYYALQGTMLLGMVWWSRSVPWPYEQPVPLICTFGALAILGGPILTIALVERALALPRYPEGHCQSCGYNLTGNLSGRCPECGNAVGKEVGTGGPEGTDA